MPSRWLLLYNCQAQGLGHCLNLMCDEVEVEQFDATGVARAREQIAESLPGYDRVLVAPQLLDDHALGLDWAALGDRVRRLPTLYFSGYHPDTCYIDAGDRPLRGPAGEYHSLVAYSSFLAGHSEDQAVARFNEQTFSRLHYFLQWDASWKRMIATFSRNGLDLAPLRTKWSRGGPFMYTVNHPRIECLRDLGRLVLEREGHKARYLDSLPADNLANGAVLPVFPPIATRLGSSGSRMYKRPGQYRYLSLEQYVAESFDRYRSASAHAIRPDFAPMLERASQATLEAA